MPKSKEPVTAAVRCLREWAVPFTGFLYPYSGGGTAEVAHALGVDEHQVVKTLIMQDAEARPLIVLMHGDCEVATGKLARQLGTKSVRPCEPKVADKHSGYQVGGTSPFATRSHMQVCCERGILDFDQIYINGGKRGYIIRLATSDLQRILEPMLFEMAA